MNFIVCWLSLLFIASCHCNNDYSDDSTCSEIFSKFEAVETRDALRFSVQCSSNITTLKWEKINDTYRVFILNVEYICYNKTSGRNTTTIIETHSERENGERDVDGLNLDKNVYCTFQACIDILDDNKYYWNANTVTCSYEDTIEQQPVAQSTQQAFEGVVSTSATILISSPSYSVPLMVLASPHLSFSSIISTSTSSSFLSQAISRSITSSTTLSQSILSVNDGSSSKGSNTTEIAFGVIGVLVILIGGSSILILIVVCFSYRKWLRKTTSIEYEYKIKSEFTDPDFGKSVSIFSIDNISTNESNITVIQSLTIQPSYAFEESYNKENVNIEKVDFSTSQTNLNNDYEEIDTASECSTVALQSPLSTDDNKVLSIARNFDSVMEGNVYSDVPTPKTQVLSNQGYIKENNDSSGIGNNCTGNSNCKLAQASGHVPYAVNPLSHGLTSDGYVSENSPDNNKDYERGNLVADGYVPDGTAADEENGSGYKRRNSVSDGYLSDRTFGNKEEGSGYKWRNSESDGYISDGTTANEEEGSCLKREDSVFDGYIPDQAAIEEDNNRLQSHSESAYISGTSTSSAEDRIPISHAELGEPNCSFGSQNEMSLNLMSTSWSIDSLKMAAPHTSRTLEHYDKTANSQVYLSESQSSGYIEGYSTNNESLTYSSDYCRDTSPQAVSCHWNKKAADSTSDYIDGNYKNIDPSPDTSYKKTATINAVRLTDTYLPNNDLPANSDYLTNSSEQKNDPTVVGMEMASSSPHSLPAAIRLAHPPPPFCSDYVYKQTLGVSDHDQWTSRNSTPTIELDLCQVDHNDNTTTYAKPCSASFPAHSNSTTPTPHSSYISLPSIEHLSSTDTITSPLQSSSAGYVYSLDTMHGL